MTQIKVDTTGRYLPTKPEGSDALIGRILLRADQLVCAQSTANRISVPLNRVCDINVASPPSKMKFYTDTVVSIAYRGDDTPRAVTVSPKGMSAETLADSLSQELLNEIPILVNHWIRGNADGNLIDMKGSLFISDDGLHIKTSNSMLIPFKSIDGYKSIQESETGTENPGIEIRHQNESQSLSTQVLLESGGYQQVLGRYLNRR